MNLILSLACDEATVRPDGKLDVGGVFNELYAPGFPAAQDRMTVVFVMQWSAGDSGRYEFRADLVDEEDQKVLTIQGHTDVDARTAGQAPPQTRLIMPLERVVFPHPGQYRFILKVGDEAREAFSLFLSEKTA